MSNKPTPLELLELLYYWYWGMDDLPPDHVRLHPMWPNNTPDRRLPMWAAVKQTIDEKGQANDHDTG